MAALVARRPDLDVGVHLVLTSESASFRWGPLTDAGDLNDAEGFLWRSIGEARKMVSAESAERELRAQIEVALAAGIPVSHLDHHMGVAVAPEFVEGTASLAIEYQIPMLLPLDTRGYYDVLGVGAADVTPAERARRRLAERGLVLGEAFAIGYIHQDEDCRAVYERLITQAGEGVTYRSLHCSAPGDIEAVHPGSAAWRIAEYELFGDGEFAEWVAESRVAVTSTRDVSRRRAMGDG